MAVERSELRLVWPPALFAQEAGAVLAGHRQDETTLGWLLAEAFHDDRGHRLFEQLTPPWRIVEDDPSSDSPYRTRTLSPNPAVELVRQLMRDAESLPRHVARQYYSRRRAGHGAEMALDLPELKAAFAREVHALELRGYFEDAFGSTCVDSRDPDPGAIGQGRLRGLLLNSDTPLWPLGRLGEPTGVEQDWPVELFLDVVEALHDLVARPRQRSWHDYGREWDYSDFARFSGQAVYRWRVNTLLTRSDLGLQLAGDGEDTGLLVQATDSARDRLVQQVLRTPQAADREEVEHALALFRRRSAGREDKRSAVVALARVLEDRRQLLEEELLSKDEGALFRIANEFDLRHRGVNGRGQRQQGDYDEAFLNWVFWWYLATVELTDHLLARQAATP